jgi:hypothetical protein
VWRIRDVYPGSDFFPSRIPDPNCLHAGSRILKEFKYFNPKKAKKWFLKALQKYDPGCSSRIPDPDADFLASRIPGSKSTQSRIPDPQHCFLTNYGSGSGSTSQKVTVPTIPVPEHWNSGYEIRDEKKSNPEFWIRDKHPGSATLIKSVPVTVARFCCSSSMHKTNCSETAIHLINTIKIEHVLTLQPMVGKVTSFVNG